MNEACIIIDLLYQIKLINPSARNIFLKQSPKLGQVITSWSDVTFVNEIINQINNKSNKQSTIEINTGAFLSVSVKPIVSSRSIVGYILILSDVTDQMLLRRELENK